MDSADNHFDTIRTSGVNKGIEPYEEAPSGFPPQSAMIFILMLLPIWFIRKLLMAEVLGVLLRLS